MANRARVLHARKKHNNAWASLISPTFIVIPAASKVLFATFVPSNPNIDETILRTIGLFTVTSDQSAVDETQIGSVGLIVVTDLAIAAGAGSIPGPSSDSNDDGWFAHQFFAMTAGLVTKPDNSFWTLLSQGRRVVQQGSQVAVMVENLHATNGLTINLQLRMLSRVTGT